MGLFIALGLQRNCWPLFSTSGLGAEPMFLDRRTKRQTRLSKIRSAVAVTACVSWMLSTVSVAYADEWPKFRKGVWQFKRTLVDVGSARKADEERVLFKNEVRRCVDPSESMKETFRPASVGKCQSTRPERIANKYVFAKRCDYMGPVRTTINVLSDSAYTEINEVQVGQFPRTDTVIARRVAECD